MKKVKVISSSSAGNFEKDVNAFLAVISSLQKELQFSTSFHNFNTVYSILIIYVEN